jgi:glyoxylase-like metal-dependent hydrolase (beta-lactamase superfamily II)
VPPVDGHDVALVRADNPGPYTLGGSNSWVVARDPAYVVDPGPADAAHLDAVLAECDSRGGLGGVAVTHGHDDHAGALEILRGRAPDVQVAGAGAFASVEVGDGDVFGPLTALATPGHSDDHLAFVWQDVGFTGDAVLGEGSVFVIGSLSDYLASLERLRALSLTLLCPGHGPPILDPAAKLDEYVAHRLDRERRLVAALDRGLRSEDDLLDAAWDDAPAELRPAAAVTLRAHLEKLRGEGRLPAGI